MTCGDPRAGSNALVLSVGSRAHSLCSAHSCRYSTSYGSAMHSCAFVHDCTSIATQPRVPVPYWQSASESTAPGGCVTHGWRAGPPSTQVDLAERRSILLLSLPVRCPAQAMASAKWRAREGRRRQRNPPRAPEGSSVLWQRLRRAQCQMTTRARGASAVRQLRRAGPVERHRRASQARRHPQPRLRLRSSTTPRTCPAGPTAVVTRLAATT